MASTRTARRIRAQVEAARVALASGRPRMARALFRLALRGVPAEARLALEVDVVEALVWEGAFERAIAMGTRLLDGNGARLTPTTRLGRRLRGALAIAQVFDEGPAASDAGSTPASFRTMASDPIAEAKSKSPEELFVLGARAFHRDEHDEAAMHLREALAASADDAPPAAACHFFLAAIAHRRGDRDAMRRHLRRAIDDGNEQFVARWAKAEFETAFPDEEAPTLRMVRRRRTLSAVRRARDLARDVWLGLQLLVLRGRALETRTFSRSRLASLVVFDAAVVVALRFVDWRADSRTYLPALLSIVAPLLFFFVPAHVATPRESGGERAGRFLRVVAGIYAAAPAFLVAAFALQHRASLAPPVPPANARPPVLLILLAIWATAVFGGIVWRAARGTPASVRGVLRAIASVAVFVATVIVPGYYGAESRLFWSAPTHGGDDETSALALARIESSHQRTNERALASALALVDAERALVDGHSETTALYFMGVAGWAEQDVFVRETRSARTMMDERFATTGRSIVLANAPFDRDAPLATNFTVRHAIGAVAKRMVRERDVLFLFLTSHGSREGLALSLDQPGRDDDDFASETLTPAALRSMLDDAGIEWRVIVIAGCETGTFVEALRGPKTLLVTAAAADRPSYGCATGNAYTDFSRELFTKQLTAGASFAAAFEKTVDAVSAAEAKEGRLASRPQLARGERIEEKLRELDAPH